MNNRQAGRRRGRGGQRPGGNPGRADNGNRIDNRARGNAAQLLEKYKNLARDAQMSGDRVTTEYYLQFADHYFRVLSESRSRFEDNARRPSNDISEEEDEDYGFEGEVASPAAYVAQSTVQQDEEREPRRDGDQRRERGEQGERPRRAEREDGGERAERPRRADRGEGGEQAERPRRADRGDGGERAERPRRAERDEAGERPARPRRADRSQVEEQPTAAREDAPVEPRNGFAREAEAREERPVPANDEAREQPRRRGRPRREAVAEVSTDGFDAALLPPSLNVETAAPTEAEPAERPRRRRRVQSDDEVIPPAA